MIYEFSEEDWVLVSIYEVKWHFSTHLLGKKEVKAVEKCTTKKLVVHLKIRNSILIQRVVVPP